MLTYWDVLEADGAVSRVGAHMMLSDPHGNLCFVESAETSDANISNTVAAYAAGTWKQAHRIDENGQFTNRQQMLRPGGMPVAPADDPAAEVIAEAHPSDDG